MVMHTQMAAAMQQMGVGVSNIETLCAFMDLPTSSSCAHHIKQVEAVMGKVQIEQRLKSEEEARRGEIKETEKREGKKTHSCTMEGHEHGPLQKCNITYGN